jgi:hypothetical protein
MEPEGSFTCSQDPATGPYPQQSFALNNNKNFPNALSENLIFV